MSIVIIGSVAIDSIKTPYGQADGILGGSATYASFAASIFTPVRLVSIAGEDFPREYIKKFKRRRVDLSGLKICKGTTFRWTGHYGENLNEAHTMSVCPEKLTVGSMKIPAGYTDTDYLFLANTDPDVQDWLLSRIKPKKMVVMDTMNLWIRNKLSALNKLLKKTDLLFINETEAKMLSGHQNLFSAAKKIMKSGPEIVVIKKGEHGAFLMSKEDFFAVPAYPMETVKDPTGAGDSFAGGFLGYLAAGKSPTRKNLRTATVMGAVTASFTVENFGTGRLEKVNLTAVEKRFYKMKNMLKF
jgi:sugar/nucleoside kinase (ribokinase family)